MTVDKKNNVIHLEQQRPPDSNPFLKLASQLIEEHATDEPPAADQQIVGDNNFQYGSNAARQIINGNGNIQISTRDPDIENRLSSLEALLKKRN